MVVNGQFETLDNLPRNARLDIRCTLIKNESIYKTTRRVRLIMLGFTVITAQKRQVTLLGL